MSQFTMLLWLSGLLVTLILVWDVLLPLIRTAEPLDWLRQYRSRALDNVAAGFQIRRRLLESDRNLRIRIRAEMIRRNRPN